ncbi:MAG: hypothetical protein ACXVH3_26090 [Solirubrobacteraceae bacterium]
MPGHPAVGVDHDLTARHPAVVRRDTEHEPPRRVHQHPVQHANGVEADPGQHAAHHLLGYPIVHLAHADVFGVLRGREHVLDAALR